MCHFTYIQNPEVGFTKERSNILSVPSALGLVAAGMGNFTDAAMTLERVLRLEEDKEGVNSPELVTNLQNLAGVLALGGRADEAKRVFLRAVALSKKRKPIDACEVKRLTVEMKAVLAGKFKKPIGRFWHMTPDCYPGWGWERVSP